MEAKTYKEMSQTTDGRKGLHEIMLADVKQRMNTLVASAPDDKKSKCEQIMNAAYRKICLMGNSDIFNFFADESVSDSNFLRYCIDAMSGTLL